MRALRHAGSDRLCFLRSAQSGIHGWGLFARVGMPQDSMVIEFRGEAVRQAVADAREAHYRAAGKDCYLFALAQDLVVDSTMHGSIARFTVSCHVYLFNKWMPACLHACLLRLD